MRQLQRSLAGRISAAQQAAGSELHAQVESLCQGPNCACLVSGACDALAAALPGRSEVGNLDNHALNSRIVGGE